MKNKEKGITLIALIITIIVMLILVAVTIHVTLNGELFTKTKTASDVTQKQVSKEQLIAAMIGAYDNTGKFDKGLVGTLPSGAKWCSEEDETYTDTPDNIQPTGTGDWIITKENNKFYVTSDGTVLDEKPAQSDIQVYYLEIEGASFYIKDNIFYFDFGEGEGLQYHEIYIDTGESPTYTSEEVSTINEQLGANIVSESTPRLIGVGSIGVLPVGTDWYLNVGELVKFELTNIVSFISFMYKVIIV